MNKSTNEKKLQLNKIEKSYDLYNIFNDKNATLDQKENIFNSILDVFKNTNINITTDVKSKDMFVDLEVIATKSNSKLTNFEILYMLKSLFEKKYMNTLSENDIKKCLDILLTNNCITNDTYEFLKIKYLNLCLSDMLLNIIPKNITEFAFYINDSLVKISNITNNIRNRLLKIINKYIESSNDIKEIKNQNKEQYIDISHTSEIETSFNNFVLTSKETDFKKYNINELELLKLSNDVKTKDTEIKHQIKYTNVVNGKKINSKKDGIIITSFQSPLDWLNKTYDLNISNTMTDKEIIQKIQATKFFEINSNQESVYNAICYLLRMKSIKEKKESGLFVSFTELHKQMGYKDDLRKDYILNYKNVISSLSNLHVNINLKQCVYAKHKEYHKLNGNIENEPLVIYTGFCKAKLKSNKTAKIIDGFETNLTKLMKMHFSFTKQYSILPKNQSSNKITRKSKLEHFEKLDNYIKKLYYINTGNNNYCTDIGFNKIFAELAEFNIKKEYEETNRKSEFLKRKILNPINKSDFIKKAEILNKQIRIYWERISVVE